MSFKKYKLFTDDEIERLRQKNLTEYNPNISALAKLQGEMESLLDGNSAVPNDDNIKILSTLEQRFNSLKKNEASLVKQQAAVNPNVVPRVDMAQIVDNDQPAEPADAQDVILNSFDPLIRPRVTLLLDSISNHPELISFDDQKHLVLNGIPIDNSNIVDSIKRLFKIRTPGKTSLKGQKSLVNLLSQIELPNALQNLIPQPQPHPPGKQIKPLNLY